MTTTRAAHRRLGGLAAVSAVALLLTACTGPAPEEGGGDAGGGYQPPAQDLTASISYAVWDQNQVEGIEENIAGFNEQYPNIDVTVNVTPFAEYWTRLQTQASSDTLPDLFWMNGPNVELYAANDQLEPITGAVEAGAVDPANYPEALVDLYEVGDVQYGVPKDFDTGGIWANRTLFEQAGVPLPEGDWTWEEFQQTAQQISDALGEEGVFGAAGGMDGQTTYYDTIFQAGGTVVEGGTSGYASPQSQAGLQFWTDLIASGASPSIQQLTDTTGDQWFVSERLAMYWGGSWFRAALSETEVAEDVVVLPLPRGEQQATVIHGVSNVVAASSPNKQAAQALQVYLAGEEAQRQQGESGVIIPAFEGTQDAFVQSLPEADLGLFVDAVAYARPLPVSASTAEWNALETELLPQAFSGDRPVAEVSAELAQQMDAVLAEEETTG